MSEWDFVAIIRPVDHPDYGEVKKYDPKGRSIEFRLRIDHGQFKAADDLTRRRMLIGAVLRSTKEAVSVAPVDIKLDEIARDVLDVARAKLWAEPEN